MTRTMLASDRVVLLLSLVPYLKVHGPTPVAELARTFDADPKMLRKLIGFLGTAGIPGETLAYQHNDLFDIDWHDFEENDVVALTHTVAVDDTPRFTGVETAALLAGLSALRPLLGPDDATVAEQLADRLGAAMGADTLPAVVVAPDHDDDRIPTLLRAIEDTSAVQFSYRDAAGTESVRTVHPEQLTEREGVWYLRGFNVERAADRTFNVQQITGLSVLAPEPERDAQGRFTQFEPGTGAPALDTDDRSAGDGQQPPASEWDSTPILAVVPSRLLGAIRGFDPLVLPDTDERVAAGSVPPGSALVEVTAWHAGAAVRLAQHGPGEIVILHPPAARAAVSAWAENALSQYGE